MTGIQNLIIKYLLPSAIICIFLIACEHNNKTQATLHKNGLDSILSSEIGEIIMSSNKDSTFIMSELTNFDWDELYIFHPYTSISKINNTLGFNWKDAKGTLINIDEGYNLLVFTKSKNVVYYLNFSRAKGDFLPVKKTEFNRSNSKFLVKLIQQGQRNKAFIYEF